MKHHFVVLNGSIKFDGDCEKTRAHCGAVCCKNTIVLLSEDEKDSGDYDFVTTTDGCNCGTCQMMRSKNRVSLRRRDSGCTYLDGIGQCTIYEKRPQVCKDFDCPSTWWRLGLMPVASNKVNEQI